MKNNILKNILEQLSAGEISVDAAVKQIGNSSLADLNFAAVDLDRARRCGILEVIFAEHKTPEQVIGIAQALLKNKQNVLATRVSAEMARAVRKKFRGLEYHATARALTKIIQKPKRRKLKIAVVCAGTSDLPVAEEAAVTLEFLGNNVLRVNDVGVAGLHRLLKRLEEIRAANAIIVVAGMEGALASVVGGLVDKPVIAVPTSVGYGASFGGVAALLTMLNTCAAGVSVVNIDNGFGAACCADAIVRNLA